MLAAFEEAIGYQFKDKSLFKQALTHKSYSFEHGACRHNERLEFLGDSVLAAVVAHRLFETYPEEDEGRLSKMKAALVARSALARWASSIGLGAQLLLGSGEESTGGRERPSMLADALEALIGAVYLDGGYAQASRMIQRLCLDRESEVLETDHKSRLQELLQKRHKTPPEYRLVKASGPDHDKTFSVAVHLGSKQLGVGRGKSKKEAEQEAALDALKRLEA